MSQKNEKSSYNLRNKSEKEGTLEASIPPTDKNTIGNEDHPEYTNDSENSSETVSITDTLLEAENVDSERMDREAPAAVEKELEVTNDQVLINLILEMKKGQEKLEQRMEQRGEEMRQKLEEVKQQGTETKQGQEEMRQKLEQGQTKTERKLEETKQGQAEMRQKLEQKIEEGQEKTEQKMEEMRQEQRELEIKLTNGQEEMTQSMKQWEKEIVCEREEKKRKLEDEKMEVHVNKDQPTESKKSWEDCEEKLKDVTSKQTRMKERLTKMKTNLKKRTNQSRMKHQLTKAKRNLKKKSKQTTHKRVGRNTLKSDNHQNWWRNSMNNQAGILKTEQDTYLVQKSKTEAKKKRWQNQRNSDQRDKKLKKTRDIPTQKRMNFKYRRRKKEF